MHIDVSSAEGDINGNRNGYCNQLNRYSYIELGHSILRQIQICNIEYNIQIIQNNTSKHALKKELISKNHHICQDHSHQLNDNE